MDRLKIQNNSTNPQPLASRPRFHQSFQWVNPVGKSFWKASSMKLTASWGYIMGRNQSIWSYDSNSALRQKKQSERSKQCELAKEKKHTPSDYTAWIFALQTKIPTKIGSTRRLVTQTARIASPHTWNEHSHGTFEFFVTSVTRSSQRVSSANGWQNLTGFDSGRPDDYSWILVTGWICILLCHVYMIWCINRMMKKDLKMIHIVIMYHN